MTFCVILYVYEKKREKIYIISISQARQFTLHNFNFQNSYDRHRNLRRNLRRGYRFKDPRTIKMQIKMIPFCFFLFSYEDTTIFLFSDIYSRLNIIVILFSIVNIVIYPFVRTSLFILRI